MARAQAKKRRIADAINITGVKSSLERMREPAEIPNIRTAVKWKCMDCMGWESDGCGSLVERIRQCECPHCPLYPWRAGVFNDGVLEEKPDDESFYDYKEKPWRK